MSRRNERLILAGIGLLMAATVPLGLLLSDSSCGSSSAYSDCLRNGRAYLDEVDVTPIGERDRVVREKCDANVNHWPSR